MRNHNRSNAFVLHIEKCKSLPLWEGAEVIEKGIRYVQNGKEGIRGSSHLFARHDQRETGIFYMGQVWSENGIKEAQGRVRKRTEREMNGLYYNNIIQCMSQ